MTDAFPKPDERTGGRVHTPSLPIADLASFVAAALSTFAWLVSPSRRARARKERASIARRLAESRP